MTEVDQLRGQLILKVEHIQELKKEVTSLKEQLQTNTGELIKKDDNINKLKGDIEKYKDVLMVIIKANEGKLKIPKESDISILPPDMTSLFPDDRRTKREGVSAEPSAFAAPSKLKKEPKDFNNNKLITQAIRNNDFLQHLHKEQIEEIVGCMASRTFKTGDIICKEGAVGTHLYVISGGEVEVTKNGISRGKMKVGKVFGELAILYKCPRTATITALTACTVWALERKAFQQIMMQTSMVKHNAKLGFLKTVHFLKEVDDNNLMKLADALEDEVYQDGEFIIREGTLGETFFIISEGRVVVDQEGNEIRSLGPGEFFGEIALMGKTPHERVRTANVKALTSVSCLTLDREYFLTLIGDISEIKEKTYPPRSQPQDQDIPEPLRNVSLSDVVFLQTLGMGGFGRVELIELKGNKKTYALKCLSKVQIVETRQQEHIFNEKNIMMQSSCPFICQLYRTFRDSRYLYMLMEVCLGGEVWTLLRDRGHFPEQMTRFIIGCVVEALQYLHDGGTIYRDLKPENLLFDKNGYVKLTDFGFAKHIGFGGTKTWTFCGTPEYVAPEIILNRGHDYAADYWSLGILIFELLTGTPPFQAHDAMKTYNMILKGIDSIEFPRKFPRTANHLVRRLCKDGPAERLGYQRHGLKDIKMHRWFQGFDWAGLTKHKLTAPYIPHIKSDTDTSNFDPAPNQIDSSEIAEDLTGWDREF